VCVCRFPYHCAFPFPFPLSLSFSLSFFILSILRPFVTHTHWHQNNSLSLVHGIDRVKQILLID